MTCLPTQGKLRGRCLLTTVERRCVGRATHLLSINSPLLARYSPSGYVAHIEALPLAEIALEMGAGRKLKTDVLDMAAGVELLVKRGDKVEKGQPWLRLHHNNRVPEVSLCPRALEWATLGPPLLTCVPHFLTFL